MYFKVKIPMGLLVALFFATAFVSAIVLNFNSINEKTLQVSTTEKLKLPIIMYHSISKTNPSNSQYIFSPISLESDLKYITQNGYTTVSIEDLINYSKGESLPQKSVMLTFDDGFYNNYYYAFPLLKKYNCKAVISPIGSEVQKYTENKIKEISYSYCSVKELKTMSDSGLVEIANHSYNMHKTGQRLGMSKLITETNIIYKNLLTADINKSQKLFISNNIKESQCLTFPYGAVSKEAIPIVKGLGYRCTLTCQEKVNYITHNSESLFQLGRFNRNPNMSTIKFFERICS